jgi:hypothetical protein
VRKLCGIFLLEISRKCEDNIKMDLGGEGLKVKEMSGNV